MKKIFSFLPIITNTLLIFGVVNLGKLGEIYTAAGQSNSIKTGVTIFQIIMLLLSLVNLFFQLSKPEAKYVSTRALLLIVLPVIVLFGLWNYLAHLVYNIPNS